ncbi:MAG TPA: hypothetical protein VGL42_08775 [Opitutaceae bacterium]
MKSSHNRVTAFNSEARRVSFDFSEGIAAAIHAVLGSAMNDAEPPAVSQ